MDAHALSLSSPVTFWAQDSVNLSWTTPPKTILQKLPTSEGESPQWSWFPDGKLSASYNLVTRHVLDGRGDATAVLWDSPVSGEKRRITYSELQTEMELAAEVLRNLGVKAGERVLIYMPMIPEALIAMLACTHIGAIHVVVFGGFAPTECAKRIESAKPLVVLTASCGIEGKRIIPYLPLIREAIDKSAHKPAYVLLHQRPQLHAVTSHARNEINWRSLLRSAHLRKGSTTPPPYPGTVPVPNSDKVVELGISLPATAAHYILHTSGTTGTPKGVIRPLSHLVGLSYTMRELMQMKKGDVLCCCSDIGWVVGHAYIVYAPLVAGVTSVMYEGKPIGTPGPGTFWRLVEEYSVNVLFCAPSALRAISRDDPQLDGMKTRNLKSLRSLFLAGERSEPALVSRFESLLSIHCAPGARVVDNWWSTESGSPMTGLLRGQHCKPGSAGKPLPGWNIRVVSDSGEELPPNTQGNVVIGLPLSPTALAGLWGERQRLWNSYFRRFNGRWMDTGDVGFMDADGYLTIVSRGDDVINVAAHRLGTAVIEGVVAAVDGVVEAFVVPVKDELKGQAPVAFVVLKPGVRGEEEAAIKAKVREAVRKEVGPIAAVKEVIRIPATAVPRTRSGKTQRRFFKGVLEGVKDVPEAVTKSAWETVIQKVEEVGLVPKIQANL